MDEVPKLSGKPRPSLWAPVLLLFHLSRACFSNSPLSPIAHCSPFILDHSCQYTERLLSPLIWKTKPYLEPFPCQQTPISLKAFKYNRIIASKILCKSYLFSILWFLSWRFLLGPPLWGPLPHNRHCSCQGHQWPLLCCSVVGSRVPSPWTYRQHVTSPPEMVSHLTSETPYFPRAPFWLLFLRPLPWVLLIYSSF